MSFKMTDPARRNVIRKDILMAVRHERLQGRIATMFAGRYHVGMALAEAAMIGRSDNGRIKDGR
jgi:hypothetical protein